VIVDDYKVESNIVSDAAGLPIVPGDRAYLVSRKNEISVSEYIARAHPRFLVYSESGTLRRSLELSPVCLDSQRVAGIVFHCAYNGQVYRVYELSYP
jgi:hypothetical protein